MARVVWSDKALREVESIAGYFLETSPLYSLALAESLILSTDTLETFPRLGRIVPELEDGRYRELVVESYRVVYDVEDDNVTILTVLHGRRNVGAILRALREQDPQ